MGTAGHRAIWLFARFCLAVGVIVILSAGILFLRLSQGPVALHGLSEFLVERANANSETVRVAARTVLLDLGDGSVPTGLEFRDVSVESVDGAPLFVVPRLRASFDLTDLVRGYVRPRRISVLSADAQFIRSRDGRIRFGLGHGEGVALESEDGAATTDAGIEAIADIVDGFVGDRDLPPEMSKLTVIEILDANVYFSDRRIDGELAARHANLRIRRDEGGARVMLDIAGGSGTDPGEIVRLFADRRAGTGMATLSGRFGRVDVQKIAAVLPALGFLEDTETLIEGEVSASFTADGVPTSLNGVIVADGGSIVLGGETHAFDMAALTLSADLRAGVIGVSNGLISTPAGDTRLEGLANMLRGADGTVAGMQAQVDIEELTLNAGSFFEERVGFDDGQIVLAWSRSGQGVEIAESWLGNDDIDLRFSGRVHATPGGVMADLHAETGELTVAELIRYWPPEAATNARKWIAENITAARLDGLTADLRVSDGKPRLSLTTGFSGLDAEYIDGMSPIREAAGDLHVSWTRLNLAMDAGSIDPGTGADISLAGSTLIIKDLWARRTPADIRIVARGPTRSVLTLIDQKPLRLLRALGFRIADVNGSAEVTATLNFPLIDALQVEDVNVETDAVLSGTRLGLPVADDRTLDVRADRLTVTANSERMRLGGDVLIDGAPASLDWDEDYSARPAQRRISLTGRTTPEMLREAGLDDGTVRGSSRIALQMRQRGNGPMQFDLEADLRDAALDFAALNWSKPVDVDGKLSAKGSLGEATVVDEIRIEAPGLTADGRIRFQRGGGIGLAEFSRVLMPGRLDAGVTVRKGADGVSEIAITGRLLDISDELGGSSDGAARKTPVRIALALQRLKVTESIVINQVTGRLERSAAGEMTGTIEGALGPDAPISIALQLPAEGEGRVTLNSSNAGAALRHAGIYQGASGGTLRVDARIGDGQGGGLTGQAQVENVTVRSQSTFRDVLTDGGLTDAGEAVSNSGIGFRSVSIPFRYRDGIVTVTDAIAVSPALGLKMTGTLDENTDAIDLTGVLSPAYALTGALNEIPLLGEVLSGGRGEGILAMTFTLNGAMNDPRFTVNPLSLLTPGVLRKLFTGGGEDAPAEFRPSTVRPQR